MDLMRDYVDACAAFGECLNKQVLLGARIVAAFNLLASNPRPGDAPQRMMVLRRLRRESRSGQVELRRLKRVMDRERKAAKGV